MDGRDGFPRMQVLLARQEQEQPDSNSNNSIN